MEPPQLPRPGALVENRWDEAKAPLSPEALLLYRSNLLGADPRVTNYGGGNTSAKLAARDPLTGESVDVLWVKGSGGDLGSMALDGFATLYLDKLLAARTRYRGPEREDEMVGLYAHMTFNLNPRATSIDTALHALIAHPHVDHVHPDAIIAIAAAEGGEALTREVFGDEIGWLPWRRPGFELGLWLERFVSDHKRARGVVLESHGLFTWGETQKDCYDTTIATINRAIAWLAEHGTQPAFGGAAIEPLPPASRRALAAALMPALRGRLGGGRIGHFDDSPEVLEFVCGRALATLAPLGTSCPDHFLRTKIRPLLLAFDPSRETAPNLIGRLDAAIADYRAAYAAYYTRRAGPNAPAMRDPGPVIILVPGVGLFGFAADKPAARIACAFYVNAINVMRGASAVSAYRALPEREAFGIEYWQLEEAKLQRLPRPRALAGKVALITGGAGGIGLATARRLAADGAALVLCDIDREALRAAQAEIAAGFGADAAVGLWVDVTDEASVIALHADAAVAFGGVDICVSNAGIASAAAIDETSLALWNRNLDILATGYFLVTRESFRLMKAQGTGGAIVVVASKNAMVASPGAAAYCVAKASEVHLARCLALEGAPFGIRANVVNPDAVLRGSRIWQGAWGDARAASNQTTREGLEAVYVERSLLKRGVYPEDIAEAVAHFAIESRSGKSTGNILNVDAGNAAAFSR